MQWKIDIGIDGDEFSTVRIGAAVGVIVRQKTFHMAHAASEKISQRMRAQMRQRILDENINGARDEIVSGRTELAFAANDFAFAKTMDHGRALCPVIELRAWDLF